MTKSLVERVAALPRAHVEGTFYRHAALGRDAFAGGLLGRWGRNFPVIYLGRPEDSIVVEAYRHLVEPHEIDPSFVQPRVRYATAVTVDAVLDLTVPESLAAVGLEEHQLRSAVDDYGPCQDVARVAHQLELHGILAPAATGLGQTLALFAKRITASERPVILSEETWAKLPRDPRIPRAVRELGQHG
jgi:RES domain-containing protein